MGSFLEEILKAGAAGKVIQIGKGNLSESDLQEILKKLGMAQGETEETVDAETVDTETTTSTTTTGTNVENAGNPIDFDNFDIDQPRTMNNTSFDDIDISLDNENAETSTEETETSTIDMGDIFGQLTGGGGILGKLAQAVLKVIGLASGSVRKG